MRGEKRQARRVQPLARTKTPPSRNDCVLGFVRSGVGVELTTLGFCMQGFVSLLLSCSGVQGSGLSGGLMH